MRGALVLYRGQAENGLERPWVLLLKISGTPMGKGAAGDAWAQENEHTKGASQKLQARGGAVKIIQIETGKKRWDAKEGGIGGDRHGASSGTYEVVKHKALAYRRGVKKKLGDYGGESCKGGRSGGGCAIK